MTESMNPNVCCSCGFFPPTTHPPTQALELREGCSCPALPTTDPRAVFSKTVQALLEKDKGKGEQQGARKASLIYGLASVPTGLPAALLAANSLPASSNVDQGNKEPGSAVDSQ